jgi:hypothetical protein
MISVKINSVTVAVEQGTEWIDDGTEEFDMGTLLLINSTSSTPYADFSDVELTINSEVFDCMVKKDRVTRTSNGKWQHEIELLELVFKLAFYQHPDRLFDTWDGDKLTYKEHLERLINTAFYGKTEPISIATATQTFLNVVADEKEYSGGNFLVTCTDMFRALNAIPTLNSDGEIGHILLRDIGSSVSFSRVDGMIIESDITDYGYRVYSKVKNATYEGDLIAGGTYYPNPDDGVTVRSSNQKYSDSDAQFVLDSGIRRIIDARAKNIDTDTEGTQTNVLIKIVSKDEWDLLTEERDSTEVYKDDYRNNTPYFVEGDNVIYNVGTEYDYGEVYLGPKDVLSQAIRKAIYNLYGVSEYSAQDIDEIEMTFYYQPIRDFDVAQVRYDYDRVNLVTTVSNDQKDSKLDLSRFGIANKQFINRLGNDQYHITVRYFEKDSPTIPSKWDYDSNGYTIIKRQFLVRDTSMDVTFLLVKNHSQLNPYTNVKKTYVSPFTVTKREVLFNPIYEEYIEFSTTRKTDTSYMNDNIRYPLFNAFSWSASQDTPIYNCLFTRDSSTYIAMSVQSIPMGQSFVFNAQFLNKTIAGYQLASDTIGKKLNPVVYTDSYGQVTSCRFQFGHESTVTADTHPVSAYTSNYDIDVPLENVYKGPNEKLGMTAILHCISDVEGLFIGDYFLQNNSLIKELGVSQSIGVAIYDTNPRYTIYDTHKKDGEDSSSTITFDTSDYEYFTINSATGKSWAIYNNNSSHADYKKLYFAFNYTDTSCIKIYANLLRYDPNVSDM